MTKTSETGHAKNVSNFETLISYVVAYGESYKPSRASITLRALNSVLVNAKNAINSVHVAYPAYANAVALREVAFAPLSKLVTRVMNALKATDTTEQIDESARSLARKIQGTRSSVKKTDEEKKALAAEGKEVKEISASQMSYDSRLDNFDKLIKFLGSIPQYAPNEEDLKIATLTTLNNDLLTKNKAVIDATAPLSNARIARDNILYLPITGLVDIAFDTKTYIKSVFGASSPQYKQVSGLEFKAVKK
jgi:hypothetical protein